MAAHGIRGAEPEDRDDAASTLASAFSDDPMFRWMLGSRLDSDHRLLPLFHMLVGLELRKPFHGVDIVDTGGGVALWHGIDDWRTPVAALIRATPATLRTFGRRLPRALRALTMVEKVHPRAPHVHLAYIGVHRDRQGQGLGGALLAAATERLDTQGLAAYLENSNPRNEALYARYGFVPQGPIELPPGAPPVLAMWRDPR